MSRDGGRSGSGAMIVGFRNGNRIVRVSPDRDNKSNSPSEPDIQVSSPAPPIPSGSTAMMASPGALSLAYLSNLSPSHTWMLMEVNCVLYHLRDSRDCEAEGVELRRAIAAQLVTEGQVYHPSRLNPRAGLKQLASGGTPPAWLQGK